MTPRQFQSRQKGVARRLTVLVRRLLLLQGAPASEADRVALALSLYPIVSRQRNDSFRFAVAMLRHESKRLGVDLRLPQQRPYSVDALVKVLERATGVGDAPLVEVRVLDPVTQRRSRQRVQVTESNRRDPVVVRQVSDRAAATVARHAQQAGREAVEDAANASGPIVGWARVLSGSENCGFCAMLASRGPVYRSEHVVKYTNIAGTDTYHDHCDCQAVLVRKGADWVGRGEYEHLSALWASSTRGVHGKAAVAAFSKAWKQDQAAQVAA